MLQRIGPEIRVMEVDVKLHSVLGRAFSDFDGFRDVVIPAAIAMAFAIVRIVPNADANHVDAVFGKDVEEVAFLAVEVVILDPALLQGDDAGAIHAEDKVIG